MSIILEGAEPSKVYNYFSLGHDGHNMVRAYASRARWAVGLHIVCATLGERDRYGRVRPFVGTELSVDPLAGGGVGREVIEVGAFKSIWNFIYKGRIAISWQSN